MDKKTGTLSLEVETISVDLVVHPGHERRMAVQLLLYWDKLRGTRLFPSEKLINPEEIASLWDNCYLIQVNDLANRHRVDFTYLGSQITRMYRDSFMDSDEHDIISPASSRLAQNFQQVIDGKKPIMQSGAYMNSRGNTIRFRQCMLPIGESDDYVEAIFGCMGMKLYP